MSVATSDLPEVILRLGRGPFQARREDEQLRLLVGVVVDRAERVAAAAHRRLRPRLEDVVVDLERDHPRDHEVDLLLARVTMPVTAATTGSRQHSAPTEGDLFGRDRARVPALLAVAGVVRHEVERDLATRDGVRLAAAHRRPSARSPRRSSRTTPARATPQAAEAAT